MLIILPFYVMKTVIMKPGMRGKLNNLLIQLRKNCAHPDLLESAFDSAGTPLKSTLLDYIFNFSYREVISVKW